MTPPSKLDTLKINLNGTLQRQGNLLIGGGGMIEVLPRLTDSLQLKIGAGYDQSVVWGDPQIVTADKFLEVRETDFASYPHISVGLQQASPSRYQFFVQQAVGPWLFFSEKIALFRNAGGGAAGRSLSMSSAIREETNIVVGLKTTLGADISLHRNFGLRLALSSHLGLGLLPVGTSTWGVGAQAGAFLSF